LADEEESEILIRGVGDLLMGERVSIKELTRTTLSVGSGSLIGTDDIDTALFGVSSIDGNEKVGVPFGGGQSQFFCCYELGLSDTRLEGAGQRRGRNKDEKK
jgi:hypothetical protein